jgi:hypothetical protein
MCSTDKDRYSHRISDTGKTSLFLKQVFDVPKFGNSRYLKWLYNESPQGNTVAMDLCTGEGIVAHYGIVIQKFHTRERTRLFGLVVNIAVSRELRGQDLLKSLAIKTCEIARTKEGISATIGLPNDFSLKAWKKLLPNRVVIQIPAIGGFVLPGKRDVASYRVTRKFLRGSAFSEIVSGLDFGPGQQWSQAWSLEVLKWRLGSPVSDYHIHVHDSGVMITTVDRYKGIPTVVILKLFPRRDVKTIDTGSLIIHACFTHKTPFYLYAGLNDRAPVKGFRIPRFLLPSPLFFLYRNLETGNPSYKEFILSSYEFLDYDAY